MTTYIVQPGRKHWTEWFHEFEWSDAPGCGRSYPVNPDGTLLEPTEQRLAWLAEDLAGTTRSDTGGRLIDLGIVPRERSYYEPGSVRCDCGHEHRLARGDSTCSACGQLFNACGQRLVPRSQWEEQYDDDY